MRHAQDYAPELPLFDRINMVDYFSRFLFLSKAEGELHDRPDHRGQVVADTPQQ